MIIRAGLAAIKHGDRTSLKHPVVLCKAIRQDVLRQQIYWPWHGLPVTTMQGAGNGQGDSPLALWY